jgi:hypothetical protein
MPTLEENKAYQDAIDKHSQAAEETGLTTDEYLQVHQAAHCLQIHKLEAAVAELQQVITLLISGPGANNPTPEKKETIN